MEKLQRIIVGRDIRLSCSVIASALIRGLIASGVDVYDIGLCGTEQVYFATSHEKMGGDIMVTASHNPIDYNGMKLVRSGARPISSDNCLNDIASLVMKNVFPEASKKGKVIPLSIEADYVKHLLGYVQPEIFTPFKVVMNACTLCAGRVIDQSCGSTWSRGGMMR